MTRIYFLFITSIFINTGCAKLTYVTSQTVEQVRLVSAGESIDEIIEKKQYDAETRLKLSKIKDYKDFYQRFFNEQIGSIYESYIQLNREYVSYLVISSSWEKIEPIKECFPIFGCFPYLGFFNYRDALVYQNKMKSNGYSTFLRPVSAYSTLGKFNDRVLSSFLKYSDRELARLIFHELTHTVLFFRNEVEFNENFANFIADELVKRYFKDSESKRLNNSIMREKNKLISELIQSRVHEINRKLASVKIGKKKKMLKNIDDLFGAKFEVEVFKVCKVLKINLKLCHQSDKTWTPARLAAHGTYNNVYEKIQTYYTNNHSDLRQFYKDIKYKYLNGVSPTDFLEKKD